jgi:hypothetical protein
MRNSVQPFASDFSFASLPFVAFAQIVGSRYDLQVPRHMQPAHILAQQRHDVVNVVLYACPFADDLSFNVDFFDGLEVNPAWGGSLYSCLSLYASGGILGLVCPIMGNGTFTVFDAVGLCLSFFSAASHALSVSGIPRAFSLPDMLRVSFPFGLFVNPVALYAHTVSGPHLGSVTAFARLTREVTAQSLRYGFLSSDDFHVCALLFTDG